MSRLQRALVLSILAGLAGGGCKKQQPQQQGAAQQADAPRKLAASQALVLDLKGQVKIQRKDGKQADAQAAAQLSAGDRLVLAAGAWVKLQVLGGPAADSLPEFSGPATVTLDPGASGDGAPKKGELSSLVGHARDGLKAMLADGNAKATGALRDPSPEELWILRPASTAIRNPRPTLHWLRGKQVGKVRVSIDATGDETTRHVHVEGLDANELVYPAKAKPLPPGTYFWVVQWDTASAQEEQSSWFTVLSRELAEEVAGKLAELDKLKASDTARKLLKVQLLSQDRYKLYLEALELVLELERSAPDNRQLVDWRKRLWHYRMYRDVQRPAK